ncbi:UNKNOWN [Stylonychia lemnae]|uniref:CUB domain-containing protein n=1 Tax=Stylonychia lemnae TaxID=5949 RepID=A0A078B0F8_STYLE|nr:UNKNOWN [Stylonychia lemnae]|eukprot:CDW86583.1 UNKNOWN [Stylonychia lemnae]
MKRNLRILVASLTFFTQYTKAQTFCYDCLQQSTKKVCYVGPTSANCCSGADCFASATTGKTESFCSDKAKTTSMRYMFCPYDSSSCMASDPYLISVMDAQQTMYTPVSSFQAKEYCYWAVAPPNEYQVDVILKIRIETLYQADCYLNFGGSITTADQQTQCVEGQTYEFNYFEKGQVSNIYIVSVAKADNAHIRFTYWAEAKLSFASLIGIITSGIVFLTLLILLSLFFFIDFTIKISLGPTVDIVRDQFTNTIEKIEPGTLNDGPKESQSDLSRLNLMKNA